MGKRKLEVGIPTGSSHQRTGTIPAWSLMPGVSPRVLATLLLLIVSLAGCSIPIGVTKVDMTKAYRDINASALTGNELSSDTVIVLHRFYLLEQFELDPA
jgi:hypothetical protein